MPGTDDVERAVDIVNAQAAALLVEALFHPLHQAALADRTALMGAIIAPGVERAIDVKDPDLQAVNLDHLALAIGDVGLACHEDFSAWLHLQLVDHCSPLWRGALRSNVRLSDVSRPRSKPLRRYHVPLGRCFPSARRGRRLAKNNMEETRCEAASRSCRSCWRQSCRRCVSRVPAPSPQARSTTSNFSACGCSTSPAASVTPSRS